jgi:hypothetical protein
MKRYILIGLIILSYLSLTGCASNRNTAYNTDLTKENWMQAVDTNPNQWTTGADNWFLTGDPNVTEVADRNAPYSAAISTMNVRVPNFSNIKVNGNFQVQIFGTYNGNSVYVYGPNNAVREAIIEVRGDTLCVEQARKVPGNMNSVIVRIGVNQLNNLIQMGAGTVEGMQLRSSYLTVTSSGRGNMYLAGNMNLKRVLKLGMGNVSIFGANTPDLDIKTNGMGNVNVSGNVGIRSIMHHGKTNINIIGANSNNLTIYADGRGKIGINGIVNLREVKARDFTQVYVYRVASASLYVYAFDKARIGLAGGAQDVYIDAFKGSCLAASRLCADNVYVRAHEWAHVNIGGGTRIFAASTENSSIYIFGEPNVMSQFISGNGTVIPIWSNGPRNCPVAQPVNVYPVVRSTYKDESRPQYPHSSRKRRWKGEG